MNSSPSSQNDPDHDEVWNLLAQAPPPDASPRFAQDTVRAARLMEPPSPWWKKLLRPAPLAGLAAASAAIAIAVTSIPSSNPANDQGGTSVTHQAPTSTESIQEIAETEALIAATDNLDEFTDQELVCLIGF